VADLSLILASDPPMAFYQSTRPDIDLAWPRLASVGDLRDTLRVSGGETPNLSAGIDNGDGALTAELADPPLLAVASLYDGADLVWQGHLSRVTIGAFIQLDLEA
jgi:hypothetical protein